MYRDAMYETVLSSSSRIRILYKVYSTVMGKPTRARTIVARWRYIPSISYREAYENFNKSESEYTKGLRHALCLTSDFPLKAEELLPLLDIFANMVKAMRRLRELLSPHHNQVTTTVTAEKKRRMKAKKARIRKNRKQAASKPGSSSSHLIDKEIMRNLCKGRGHRVVVEEDFDKKESREGYR
ncbi:hypothetical protein YC2023_030295 [Brassica napus]